jgi:hypothetical protein
MGHMSENQSGAGQSGGGRSGWVSWTGDSWADLPPEQRDQVRRTMIDRHRARGPLLAVVQVHVYADDAQPQISFTPECALGVESDRKEIAAAVARARDALAGWR